MTAMYRAVYSIIFLLFSATDLLDIIQRIQNSDGSKDCTLDPKVLKNFRQLILQTPVII